jgi:hypothetical protein
MSVHNKAYSSTIWFVDYCTENSVYSTQYTYNLSSRQYDASMDLIKPCSSAALQLNPYIYDTSMQSNMRTIIL